VEKEVLREFLRGRGLRFTPEREAILEEIASRRGHFDLEEIFEGLRRKGLKVSRASIYRTVPLLVESGIVEEVERTDKHAHYEHTFGSSHHDHMLCTGCGRVIEFLSPEMEKLQEGLCRARGFKGTGHTLEIKGLCRDCRKGKRPRRRG